MNDQEKDSERVRFRPRKVIWMTVPSALALIAVFTIVGLLLRRSETGATFYVADQVAMILIGVILAGLTMLWAVPLVRADADGVSVRNVLTKRYFSWNEVLSVSFPEGASWARLELPDDEYHGVMAVQAVDREHAVEAVRALRRLHKQSGQQEHEPGRIQPNSQG